MAKVNIKPEKITPFGGIYFASKAFYTLSLDKVINGTLGVRSSTYNGYQWDEVVSAMSDVFLCGGDCVEDVNRSECHMRESPDVRIPTSHTIGRAIKLLHSYGLHIGVFRADCGSYSEDIIRTVDGNCRIFYIRALHSASMYSRIQDIREWKRVEIGSQETEVASFMSTQFMEDSHYRIVVQRTKEKDSTPDLFGERYTYRCIITNDWESEEKSVIETYNKRGARERDFDRLNNDFGWKHLPCSFLKENTVYMILTAFCMNFFSYFVRVVSSVFTSLSPTSRIKKFVFHFTVVCAKWTRKARRWWLNLYTGMPYDKLSFG